MAKRFKNLEAALNYLRSTSDDGTGVNPQAPAGSQLRRYQEWVAGERSISYTRAAASKPGRIDELAILPFARPSGPKLIVPVSQRAISNINVTGLSTTELNVSTELNLAVVRRGFKPAQANVTLLGSGTGSDNSKITGRRYIKKGNRTYTLPFGAKATGDDRSFATVMDEIRAKILEGNTRSVSFTPEVFR